MFPFEKNRSFPTIENRLFPAVFRNGGMGRGQRRIFASNKHLIVWICFMHTISLYKRIGDKNMTQVVLELDAIEQQVLKKLIKLGLFETPQEAFKVALLKYAFDLGNLGDMKEDLSARIPDLSRPALGAAPDEVLEDQDEEKDGSDEE